MQSVLITGGSRGIGRAMVELFASEGYKVAFTYLSSEKEAKALSQKTGALALRADCEREEEILSAVSEAEAALGGIDCLINNAAISGFSLLTDITTEEWNRFLRINLTAPFIYSRAVLPAMIRKGRGRIVNITSMWGLVGASCEVHYSAAKAGLIGFTKALAKEVGPSGITVNAIAPGVIETDMNRSLSEEDLIALKDETPLSRLGRPEEIARAALFLCSEGAGFITGEIMNISGGFITP
ncbi:MAG: 3-oxoacyl-ACP reductase FabG [Clostridia bacterium]|nr:3-oxoacyl-ACP reductase FabG [Clostridia bacterium]